MPFFKSFNRKILGFFNVLSLWAISVKKIYKHTKERLPVWTRILFVDQYIAQVLSKSEKAKTVLDPPYSLNSFFQYCYYLQVFLPRFTSSQPSEKLDVTALIRCPAVKRSVSIDT